MSDRRTEERKDASDRRGFPRPSLKLNLALLALAVALSFFAFWHRQKLDARFQQILTRNADTPAEMRKIREEIARKNLDGEQLKQELAGRADYVASLQSDRFYLSLDSRAGTLTLYLGNEPAREMKMTIGPPANLEHGDKSWTFVPLRGSFQVQKRRQGLSWTPEPWAYLVNNQPVQPDPPPVANGLGELILELPNGYIIHSPPAAESPLKGAKPGSFMVPLEDLRAIWPRISEGTRVYIF